jgi:hypothetical protein
MPPDQASSSPVSETSGSGGMRHPFHRRQHGVQPQLLGREPPFQQLDVRVRSQGADPFQAF